MPANTPPKQAHLRLVILNDSVPVLNMSVCEKSHFVITNVQQLATNPEKWLRQFSRDFFDMIIVDEAHHSPTDSWRKIHEHFRDARVINMTATPFRGDAEEIEGTWTTGTRSGRQPSNGISAHHRIVRGTN